MQTHMLNNETIPNVNSYESYEKEKAPSPLSQKEGLRYDDGLACPCKACSNAAMPVLATIISSFSDALTRHCRPHQNMSSVCCIPYKASRKWKHARESA